MAKKLTKKTGGKKPVVKPSGSKAAKSAKSIQPKRKAAPAPPKAKSKPKAKARPAAPAKKVARPAKPTSKPSPKAQSKATRPTKPVVVEKLRPRPKPFSGAISAYESGIKLMYAESYEKAIKAFTDLIAAYPDEPEIQASAKASIVACEKKLHERSRTVLRGADDHYNLGVAMMNRGDLASALNHLQHALKLAPKADHILYAMAAANALHGNRDQALSYLKQSIHHRPENRFQAARESDFALLADDPGFKELVSPPEK
jgi:tetratricopeptide (TPR) repeat protein